MCTLSATGETLTEHLLHGDCIILRKQNKPLGEKMKKLIFSSLVGLALVAFTGCTTGNDAGASKCQAGECDGAKKCDAAAKCDANKASAKCQASGKCGN